jgi:hypothetical protein
MSVRKKAKPSIITNESKPKVRGTKTTPTSVIVQDEKPTTKSTNKYERVKVGSTYEQREKIQQKVKDGLLKWAFYGVDSGVAYHYYLVIKK